MRLDRRSYCLGRITVACAAGLLTFFIGCTSLDEERWRLYNENGVQAFAAGNYRDALDSFDAAQTHRSQDPVLLYNAGQCYDRLGDVNKAEQYYTYCIQLDAKNGDARLALMTLQYRTGRAAGANNQIQDWLKQQPPRAEAFVADAWRLRQEKNYPQALARVQQALSIDPHNRPALTELALLYELEGMPDRAYVQYERILERDKNQPESAARLEQLKARGVSRPVPDESSKDKTVELVLP
jgi:tetratricopeptide (TPR) repeat protein